ncbi:MAG: fumarylacetoacetate hydrolase family protein [Alphaproteobacteria bacterium]
MKLATLDNGCRDGALVVVSSDLRRYIPAGAVAATMQSALDDWSDAEPKLRDLFERLDLGQIEGELFQETLCLSPLPRAYQFADCSAYVNHVDLLRRARGADIPDRFWTDPLVYQGVSDQFLPPRGDIVMPAEAFVPDNSFGIDFEAEVAIVTGDVPMATSADGAGDHIRLVMLLNDVSLRGLIPAELEKGFGFFQSKPPSACAPVALTPGQLGAAWQDNKLHLALRSALNGRPFGMPNAGIDMTFDFGQLIAHICRTRPLGAGTIIGSGTVSNRDADGGPGKPIADGGVGYSCISEQRMVETIRAGNPQTPFLVSGDQVRIEMRDGDDQSIFGAIDQTVAKSG